MLTLFLRRKTPFRETGAPTSRKHKPRRSGVCGVAGDEAARVNSNGYFLWPLFCAFPTRESELSGKPVGGSHIRWRLIAYTAIRVFLQRFRMMADLGLRVGQNKPRRSGACGEANGEGSLTPFWGL